MWKRLAIGVLAVIAIILVAGMLLPHTVLIKKETDIAAAPDKVYSFVVAPAEWKKWSAWNTREPGMPITYSGPASGVGAVWEWKSPKQGDGKMTFTRAEPASKLGFDLEIVGMGPPSHGLLTFAPAGSGTHVTWEMTVNLNGGPFGGLLGLMMPSFIGPDFENGLASLKKVAEAK
jgi:uncharacterized protein YndB with AHSA1/START domain